MPVGLVGGLAATVTGWEPEKPLVATYGPVKHSPKKSTSNDTQQSKLVVPEPVKDVETL